MSQVCTKCARVNPANAIYCHYDGVILGGHAANGRKGQPGSQPFPNQFVFPSGQACHTFDQLAIACQENWKAAVDLLKKGFLASFFGGIGRADLAMAAQEAARFPDTDRGLDRLLAKFPSRVLAAPQLRAEPTNVNLGVVSVGTNRTFELHLANLGMRLLYGSVSSDCKWLTLGEGPGNPQKLFQFGSETVIHVQVRGQHLRAGNKPLEGHLVVESNGGTATITVRADVPPKPYPNDVLAGALTPRQIAEKAQASPKEAAPLFESGAVAKWFSSNGWTYPVQGPPAAGVGAVQQFFEALGLSKAPKVEISPTAVTLRGEVAENLQSSLELKTQEKRPVYAHGICDQPWLEVGRPMFSGRNAFLRIAVPRVPDRPGETLHAMVTVTSNGNQKFKVPVSLHIGTSVPTRVEAVRVSAGVEAELPVAELVQAPAASAGTRDAYAGEFSEPSILWHALPAGVLVFFLFVVVVLDLFWQSVRIVETAEMPVDPRPRIAFFFDDQDSAEGLPATMRFGIVAMARGEEPQKNLTYSGNGPGQSNSTVVKIGGQSRLFGFSSAGESHWEVKAERTASPWLKRGDRAFDSVKSVWAFKDKSKPSVSVRFTQLVDLIPSQPVEIKSGNFRRYLDTCRVRYVMENTGTEGTEVGLRILLDTLIGVDEKNDGVPFTVPGLSGLVNSSANFEAPRDKIPDFLQVLEVPDLQNPGIVGFMNFKLGGGIEPPGRVLLTNWSADILAAWDVPQRPFLNDPELGPDSAVVLYWGEKPLKVGAKREVGFAYGLGDLSITKGGQLGISVGGSFVPKGDLTVVALVNNPRQGQKLTLNVPAEGMRIIEGDATQTVPSAPADAVVQQSPVSWRIQADREGTFEIEVLSSTGVSQKRQLTIKAKTIF